MTKRLHRYYGAHDLHFITGSCYRRQPELGTPQRRDLFLKILEEARRKYPCVSLAHIPSGMAEGGQECPPRTSSDLTTET